MRHRKSIGSAYFILAFALLTGEPAHLLAADAGTLLDALQNDKVPEYVKGKMQQYVTDKFPSFASEQSPTTRNTYAQEIADTTDTRDKLIPVRSTGSLENPDMYGSTGDFAHDLPKPIANLINAAKSKYDNLQGNAAAMRGSIQETMHSAQDYLQPVAQSSPTLAADSRPVSAEPSRIEQASTPAVPKDFADASSSVPTAPSAAPKPPSAYDKEASTLAADLGLDNAVTRSAPTKRSGNFDSEAVELSTELGIDPNEKPHGKTDWKSEAANTDADLQTWEDQQAEKRRVAEIQRQQEVARLAEIDRQREQAAQARQLQIAQETIIRQRAAEQEAERTAANNRAQTEVASKPSGLNIQNALSIMLGAQQIQSILRSNSVPAAPTGATPDAWFNGTPRTPAATPSVEKLDGCSRRVNC